MSASLTIYNACEVDIDASPSSHSASFGWLELVVTEVDGSTHEITIHFDTQDGFARAKQIAHLAKAVSAAKEDA